MVVYVNEYELYIKTKFNEVKLLINDINDPDVKEILEQPWIEEVKLTQVKDKPKSDYKKLIKTNR